MVTTKLFTNHTTQAVRLPRSVAFPAEVGEVEIIVQGEARLIVPAGRRWDYFFSESPKVTHDFLAERGQPAPQERSSL